MRTFEDVPPAFCARLPADELPRVLAPWVRTEPADWAPLVAALAKPDAGDALAAGAALGRSPATAFTHHRTVGFRLHSVGHAPGGRDGRGRWDPWKPRAGWPDEAHLDLHYRTPDGGVEVLRLEVTPAGGGVDAVHVVLRGRGAEAFTAGLGRQSFSPEKKQKGR